MKQLYLVTGNKDKLREWRGVLPNDIEIEQVDIDLDEIQSSDPEAVVADKARRAYAATGKSVVVEDVTAGLEKLGGLPGPFIKFFIKSVGKDVLYSLAGREGERAMVSCSIAYYDGHELLTVRGDVAGTVVAPRGENGFGFDFTFVPDGSEQTYAEMGEIEKNKISHRQKAIKLFVEKLSDSAV